MRRAPPDSVPEFVTGHAQMRLLLLESDLKSLRVALSDHSSARADVDCLSDETSWFENRDRRQQAWDRMFHHAKVFVVSMRRFARLLEAAQSRRHEYPQAVADAIDVSWKATRAFFADYTAARDAIEHIDGELTGSNHHFLNLYGDHLEVVKGERVLVSRVAIDTVERAWSRIAASIPDPREVAMRRRLLSSLMRVLAARIRLLEGA